MTQDDFLICTAAWLLIGFFGMLALLPDFENLGDERSEVDDDETK